VICNPTSGSTFNNGATTVTCTASDTSGNSNVCSFTVTVNDGEAPVIAGCPANQSVSTDAGLCTAVVSYAPTAADNCDSSVTVACSPVSGSAFPKGTTHVTCTASDAAGNTSTCQFDVTVNDTEKPAVICPSNITQNTDPGLCTAAVSWTAPNANDNCAVASVVCDPISGSTFNKGATTVTCTAMDTSGNSDACTFTITIKDGEAPVIAGCPANQTVSTDAGVCTAVVTYAPTAADNCDSSVTVGCNPVSGSAFPKGTTHVACTASDAAGNTSTCQFDVTVNDTEKPSITCPANITQNTDIGVCTSAVTWTAPSAN